MAVPMAPFISVHKSESSSELQVMEAGMLVLPSSASMRSLKNAQLRPCAKASSASFWESSAAPTVEAVTFQRSSVPSPSLSTPVVSWALCSEVTSSPDSVAEAACVPSEEAEASWAPSFCAVASSL